MPNPARASVTLGVHLAQAGPLDVGVFDLAGRRVATLANGEHQAGDSTLRWSLEDDGGRRVRAGLYLAIARVNGASSAARIAVVR
jgi:hypothetical protein